MKGLRCHGMVISRSKSCLFNCLLVYSDLTFVVTLYFIFSKILI